MLSALVAIIYQRITHMGNVHDSVFRIYVQATMHSAS